MNEMERTGDLELVSALLSGGKTKRLARAAGLLDAVGGLWGLRDRGDLSPHGVSAAESERLRIALELGARALVPPRLSSPLDSPEHAYAFVAPRLIGTTRERFVVVVLDAKNRPKHAVVVAEASVDACPVDPREVFRPALREGGSGVLVAHNHPSGDPEPSRQDIELTKRLEKAGILVGMPLVDHLIVGAPNALTGQAPYTSLRALGVLRG